MTTIPITPQHLLAYRARYMSPVVQRLQRQVLEEPPSHYAMRDVMEPEQLETLAEFFYYTAGDLKRASVTFTQQSVPLIARLPRHRVAVFARGSGTLIFLLISDADPKLCTTYEVGYASRKPTIFEAFDRLWE